MKVEFVEYLEVGIGNEIELKVEAHITPASIEKHGLDSPPYEHIPDSVDDVWAYIGKTEITKELGTDVFEYLEAKALEVYGEDYKERMEDY